MQVREHVTSHGSVSSFGLQCAGASACRAVVVHTGCGVSCGAAAAGLVVFALGWCVVAVQQMRPRKAKGGTLARRARAGHLL